VPISNVIAAVFAAFLVTQVAIFITTVYLHRALTHRALTIHPAVALPFRTVIWMTTGMRPREWVAVHRKHHAATDTVDDPHSPKQVGFWRVQLGNVGLYKKVAADAANTSKYARDIPPDRLDRLAFDYSLLGLGVGTTILIVTMWALGFGLLTGPARRLLRDVVGRDQRDRPHRRQAAVRELRDEPAVARVHHRR
jgi:stearoyl-CoA desaturase (Delta-9 desaturase)